MSAAAPASLPPAVQAIVNSSLGASVIASYFSWALTGILWCLGWVYFQTFPRDPISFKILVVVLILMCTAYSFGSGYWVWDWGVAGYGNMAVMTISPVTYPVDLVWLGACPAIVQHFFAWRVWILSGKRNRILPLIIVAFSLAGFGIALWIIYMLAIHRPLAELTLTLPTAYFWLACAGAADILITIAMFWYLEGRFKNSGIETLSDRDSRFRRIVFRTVEANVLSLLAQALALALFSIPNIGMYFLVGDALLAPVYTLSLIVSLLGRTPSQDHNSSGIGMTNNNSFVLSGRRGDTMVMSTTHRKPNLEINVSQEVDSHESEWKSPALSHV